MAYSCLTINLCFGPPLSTHKVWAWSFSAPCKLLLFSEDKFMLYNGELCQSTYEMERVKCIVSGDVKF